MAFRDLFKLQSGKNNKDTQKNEVIDTLLSDNYFPVVRSSEIDIRSYRKVPFVGIAALGAAFASLPDAARTISQTVSTQINTTEQLFVGVNYKNVAGLLQCDSAGNTFGNIVQMNGQGKHVVGGRILFKPVSGGLPVEQTINTVVPFDPMSMIVAAAIMSINQKLDALQAKAEEILAFLEDTKKAEQRGHLNKLNEIMDDFKRDHSNEEMCRHQANAVQSINQKAHENIQFYQIQIARKLNECSAIHMAADVTKFMDAVSGVFCEYRLACYLCAYSSFLEVLLMKNFEHACAVSERINELMKKYNELYDTCQAQIAENQRNSIDVQIIKGVGIAAKAVGNAIASVPLINKGPVDEALLSAGESLKHYNQSEENRKQRLFEQQKDSQMNPFIMSIQMIDSLYNHPNAMLMDGENLYIKA